MVYCILTVHSADSDHLSPGPSCSKLKTSLVNVSLNFLKLISQICQYFLLKKCEKLQKLLSFFRQKISMDLLIKL